MHGHFLVVFTSLSHGLQCCALYGANPSKVDSFLKLAHTSVQTDCLSYECTPLSLVTRNSSLQACDAACMARQWVLGYLSFGGWHSRLTFTLKFCKFLFSVFQSIFFIIHHSSSCTLDCLSIVSYYSGVSFPILDLYDEQSIYRIVDMSIRSSISGIFLLVPSPSLLFHKHHIFRAFNWSKSDQAEH